MAQMQRMLRLPVKAVPWYLSVPNLDLICMVAMTAVYFLLTILGDLVGKLPVWERVFNFRAKKVVKGFSPVSKNSKVLAEESRVKAGNHGVVGVTDVHKVYSSLMPFGSVQHAVKEVSLGVKEGEVFCLLGVNGAGKTSLLSMCVGELTPSSGVVRICGRNIDQDIWGLQKQLGSCPQFDGLCPQLTVQEHLYMYARVKGVKESTLKDVVDEMISLCDLFPFTHKQAGGLSGGNKRKLSVAIALVGGPRIVFLDEPSCGVDPLARRSLWGVVKGLAAQGSGVILTTHSMEEAESLSSRVAIMAAGQLKCLGSVQEIQNEFGKVMDLFVRLRMPVREEVTSLARKITETGQMPPPLALSLGVEDPLLVEGRGDDFARAEEQMLEDMGHRLKMHICHRFPGSSVAEHLGRSWRFALPLDRKLPDMFREIEEAKDLLDIEEYSLAQASLEQIFNSFAKSQEE